MVSYGKHGYPNYAIMVLETVLGLWACDVVPLKLRDIDRFRGEIRIVRSKTANPAILPLTHVERQILITTNSTFSSVRIPVRQQNRIYLSQSYCYLRQFLGASLPESRSCSQRIP